MVTMTMERLPDEAQWSGEEAIREEAMNASASEARKFIGAVAAAKKPRTPGGVLARLLERFIAGARISVEDVQVLFQDPSGRRELSIGLQLHLQTSRSWKIEFRGTHLWVDAQLAIQAGGDELLAPVKLTVDADLPKVLRTMLAAWRSDVEVVHTFGQP
eukprot:g26465.t1